MWGYGVVRFYGYGGGTVMGLWGYAVVRFYGYAVMRL